MSQTAAWVAASDVLSVNVGLDRDEALHRADALLQRLRRGEITKLGKELDDLTIDTLRGACVLLLEGEALAEETIKDAEALFEFILSLKWRQPDFEERVEVLGACAAGAWRAARRLENPGAAEVWWRRLRDATTPAAQTVPRHREIRSEPGLSTLQHGVESLLELSICLREQFDSSPLSVLNKAASLYQLIGDSDLRVGRFDERQYFLGEFALIAGVACRQLARRDEARGWFDRAEAAFAPTTNVTAELLRVSYQRLALRLEERQPDVVLELIPAIAKSLAKLGLAEEALKCRFLEVVAFAESGQAAEALKAAEETCKEAKDFGNQRLLALAYVNVAQHAGILGESPKTLDSLNKAIPILTALGDRVGLAKARWGMANLLRTQGRVPEAIDEFRSCIRDFEGLGMVADVASLRLAVADLLLESDQEQEAIREVRSALPIIEELKMIPERQAAISLLRESLRDHEINREAFSDLRRYLEDLKA